jgi:hypothetical protein
MALTRIAPDTGALIKPGPMTVAPPDRVVLDADMAAMGADAGLNGGFLADVLASAVTHERMGMNLFRMLHSMTNNPMLQPMYSTFLGDAERSVDVYERLIGRLGGNVAYVSPAGRMTEGMDTKIIESFQGAGSADQLTVELKGVEAVLASSALCVANVGLLRTTVDALPEGDETRLAMEEAVSELEGPAHQHLEWAVTTQQTMVAAQVSSKLAQTVGAMAEEVVGKVKDAFGR